MLSFEELAREFVATKIHIGWRTNVQTQQGQRRSRWKGEGGEYADIRPFRSGDRVTQINQKLRAKDHSRLYVNLLESEQRVVFSVVVDRRHRMQTGTQRLNKAELSAILAGSVMASAHRTGDIAQLLQFDEHGVHSSGRAIAARRLLQGSGRSLLRAMEANDTTGGGFTTAAQHIRHQKSLVCVVSDFRDWSEEDYEALRQAAMQHEVVCYIVHDLREAELPSAPLLARIGLPGLYTVEGAKGESQLVIASVGNRRAYNARFTTARGELEAKLAQFGCKWCSFCTDETPENLHQHQLAVLKTRRHRGPLDREAD